MLKFPGLTKSHFCQKSQEEKKLVNAIRKSRRRKLQRGGFNVSCNYKKKGNTHIFMRIDDHERK